MIKIIAFDLVGVLVREKNIELSESEDKLERLFGPNLSDSDYIESASNIIDKDVVVDTAKSIIDKLSNAIVDDPPTLARDGNFIKKGYNKIKTIKKINNNLKKLDQKYMQEIYEFKSKYGRTDYKFN